LQSREENVRYADLRFRTEILGKTRDVGKGLTDIEVTGRVAESILGLANSPAV
jgi:hypothetical protein